MPAIAAQWYLQWDYRWCGFLLQAPREPGAPLQTIGYAAMAWDSGHNYAAFVWLGRLPALGGWRSVTIYCKP